MLCLFRLIEEATEANFMDMSAIRQRMEELGIDLAALTRRYCDIRQAKGEASATPVNRRSMIAKAVMDDGNPKLETFLDILEALDGEILIQWKDTKIQKFGDSQATGSTQPKSAKQGDVA